MKKYLALVTMLLLFSITTFSQNLDYNISIVKVSLDKLAELDSVLFKNDNAIVGRIDYEKSEFKDNPYVLEWVEMQKKYFRQNNGLVLSGSYNYKYGSQVVDESYDDTFPYNNKAQLSITWNIFEQGIIGRKSAYKMAYLKGLQLSNAVYRNQELVLYEKLTTQNNMNFNSYYNYLNSCKIDLLKSLLVLYEELKNKNKLLDTEINRIERQIASLSVTVRYGNETSEGVFDVYDYVLRQQRYTVDDITDIVKSDYTLIDIDIDNEILSVQKESSKYINDVKLSPFVRGQYYNRNWAVTTNKVNVDAGISFSLPINTQYKSKRSELSSRIMINNEQASSIREKIVGKYTVLVDRLNHNLNMLNASLEVLSSANDNLNLTKKMFDNQRMTLQDMFFGYSDYIEYLFNVYDLIQEREGMMLEFMSAKNGITKKL